MAAPEEEIDSADALLKRLEWTVLRRLDGILQSCRASTLADITTSALATFCRGDKVTNAVAIGAALTPATAQSITPLAGLLHATAQ